MDVRMLSDVFGAQYVILSLPIYDVFSVQCMHVLCVNLYFSLHVTVHCNSHCDTLPHFKHSVQCMHAFHVNVHLYMLQTIC